MIVKRLLQSVLTIVGLVALVFFAIRMAPGDPAVSLAGPNATAEDIAQLRASLGLDQPLYVQFLTFVTNAVHGDFGTSIQTNVDVMSTIASRVPATILLATSGMVLAVLLGIAGGITSAAKVGGFRDATLTVASTATMAVPSFWLGIMLIDLFAIRLHLLPSSGIGTFAHLILPALVVGVTNVGMTMRVTRSSVIEMASGDFVRTARSKGLRPSRLWLVHILRPAAIPIVTVVGLELGLVLGGTVITEAVFDWPGVGQLLISSVQNRDYPMIQGLAVFFAVVFALVNLLVDVGNTLIDPRLRRTS